MRLNKINFGRTFLEVDDVYSDLYRRFASCFNSLLEPEINDEDYIINCYVESNAETRMVDCINSSTDGIFHLIGYTGIGKTTLLCHLMSTHPNCTVPIIEKSILYLPTFFDSHVSEVNEEITDSISRKFASYCRFLHNTFSPAIVSEKEQLNKSLYELISSLKNNLLEYGIANDSDFLNDSPQQQLNYLKKSNSFAYYLCMFKLLLDQPETTIENVVLVLDDIESLKETHVIKIMDVYHHAYECIKNMKKRKYKVKLIISGRPHTFRFILENNVLKRQFESYGVSHEIPILNPPSLDLIFEKRFNYFKQKLQDEGKLVVSNVTSWNEAYNILIYICSQADINLGATIYELNFYNIRESMLTFVKLLCNRMWLQRNLYFEASFTVSLNNFNLSSSALLKAVIHGNNNFYANNQLVPNIFLSNKYKNYSFYCLLIIKYFIFKNSIHNYGRFDFDVYSLFNDCSQFWENNILHILEECVNYLIEKKILLYSIHEEEYENKNITINDKRKLYLSSKGLCIWNMLASKSVLLECYREDTYRDYSHSEFYDFNSNLSQEQVLIDTLNFVSEIALVEVNNVKMLVNSNLLDNFEQVFGEGFVSHHLLSGVRNTFRYYFEAYDRELPKELKKMYSDINNYIHEGLALAN